MLKVEFNLEWMEVCMNVGEIDVGYGKLVFMMFVSGGE